MTESISRRALLKRLSLSAGVGAAAVPKRPAKAAQPALLDVNDPAAIKVSYLLEVSHLDMKLHPTYVVGSRCENCMLILDKPGYAYRPCSLFPGKLVKTSGWCTSWAPQI